MYQYLFVDYETFGTVDLPEVGLDNYVKHQDTGISMLGWAFDNEPVEIWLPHKGPMPQRLRDGLLNALILKIAWNSPFEDNVTRQLAGIDIPLEQWRDPTILARNLSLPGKLEDVAAILKMAEQKDPRGDELKRMFCLPVAKGGEMTLFGIAPPLFRDHNTHPKEFAEYIEYCKQDVRTERAIWYRLIKVPFPEQDWKLWLIDQKINALGMPGNRQLAEKALRIAERYIKEQKEKLKKVTGLENPNSDHQMKEWLSTRGYSWGSLRKEYVQAELDNPASKLTQDARTALILRKETRKSSYRKLERFLLTLSIDDDRLRNQFRYMGAPRTGRWSSGGGEDGGDVQVQNLPRGDKAVKKKLIEALQLIDDENYDALIALFPKTSPVAIIITILRSLFQAKPGYKIVVSDLNAIENRVLGWMAGCKSILDVFRRPKEDGGDPYLAFACFLFNKTYAQVWADFLAGNEDERQGAKAGVLGGGYGQGGGELKKNEFGDEVRGGLWGYAKNVCGIDITRELSHRIVKVFREAYPEVVQLWTDLEEAFKQVLKEGGEIIVGDVSWDRKKREWVPHPTCLGCKIKFRRIKMEGSGYMVRMELPSSRALHYLNATVEKEEAISPKTGQTYTREVLYYDGIEHSSTIDAAGNTSKKRHVWGRTKTYGGKLTENADQAISRDAFGNGIILADEMGFPLFGVFHDEAAAEVKKGFDELTVHDLSWCLSQVPWWAPGLILGAEGYEGPVYRK